MVKAILDSDEPYCEELAKAITDEIRRGNHIDTTTKLRPGGRVAITFHAIYNLLIAYGGAAQYIAYLLPVLILTAGKLIFRSPIQ